MRVKWPYVVFMTGNWTGLSENCTVRNVDSHLDIAYISDSKFIMRIN